MGSGRAPRVRSLAEAFNVRPSGIHTAHGGHPSDVGQGLSLSQGSMICVNPPYLKGPQQLGLFPFQGLWRREGDGAPSQEASELLKDC